MTENNDLTGLMQAEGGALCATVLLVFLIRLLILRDNRRTQRKLKIDLEGQKKCGGYLFFIGLGLYIANFGLCIAGVQIISQNTCIFSLINIQWLKTRSFVIYELINVYISRNVLTRIVQLFLFYRSSKHHEFTYARNQQNSTVWLGVLRFLLPCQDRGACRVDAVRCLCRTFSGFHDVISKYVTVYFYKMNHRDYNEHRNYLYT